MQKTHKEFDQLDIRSIRILKFLLESNSISKTAEYIGLSQPATSRIVTKLRKLLGDPLLVRVDTGFGLTPHAQQLYPKLIIALESMNAVVETQDFNIAHTKATLKIASTDYGLLSVLRYLYPVLLEKAPGVSLEISHFTPRAFTLIEQGELDLALFADFNIPGDFHYRTLFEEDYCVLARKDHPLFKSHQKNCIKPEQMTQYSHVEMMYPSISLMQYDDVISMNKGSDDERVQFRLPYFLAAVTLLENSDSIIALPTRICLHAQQHYALRAMPLCDSDRFTYVAIWHHRQHQRPLLRWILNKIEECNPKN